MAGEELSAKEQEKATILTAAIAGRMTNGEAAKQLGLSKRQVQRAKASIRKGGARGIIHQLKGKPSNHRIGSDVKEQVLELIKKNYPDFKPTLATEQLAKHHDIHISAQTTRRWMAGAGLWNRRKERDVVYRSWRPRKEYYGELEQFDGSYHRWFEGR